MGINSRLQWLFAPLSDLNLTNSFIGDYEVYNDSNISIGTLLWTEIGEPKWDQLFHSIESSESYLLNGDTLIIYYNQNKNGITLINN